jgi:hypothetical protein
LKVADTLRVCVAYPCALVQEDWALQELVVQA